VGPCQTECLPGPDRSIDSSWVPRLGWSIRACPLGEHEGERAGGTWSTEPMLRRVRRGPEVEGRMGDERRHGARGGGGETSEVRAG